MGPLVSLPAQRNLRNISACRQVDCPMYAFFNLTTLLAFHFPFSPSPHDTAAPEFHSMDRLIKAGSTILLFRVIKY
jgi:hypothetical protein